MVSRYRNTHELTHIYHGLTDCPSTLEEAIIIDRGRARRGEQGGIGGQEGIGAYIDWKVKGESDEQQQKKVRVGLIGNGLWPVGLLSCISFPEIPKSFISWSSGESMTE